MTAAEETPQDGLTRREVARMGWILLAVVLAHGAGVAGDFTLDDRFALLQHPVVRGDAPWWEAFTREWFGRPLFDGWSSSYRPLATLSFWLVAALGGLAFGQHLGNLAAYGLLCLLVYRLGARHIGTRAAWFAALLFALTPVHVENVASVVGRADLLAAILAMVAFDLLDRPKLGAREIALGCAAYFAALLCKESVALLPAILMWRGWLRHRSGTAERAHLLATLAISLTGLLYIIPRHLLLPVSLPEGFNSADNLLRSAEGLTRIWGGLGVWGEYFGISLRGAPLCADHTWGAYVPPAGISGPGAASAWLGLGLAAVAVVDALRAARRGKGGWFFATALAALLLGHFIIPLSVIVAERLLLWPSVFASWGLAASLEGLVGRGAPGSDPKRPQQLRLGLLLALPCIAWGAQSFARTLDWRDDLSVYRSSAEACPRAVHNRVNLAFTAARAGLDDEALWHFGVASTLRQQFPARPEAAIFELEAARGLILDPSAWASRLPQLPLGLGVDDTVSFWRGLADFAASQGLTGVAARAGSLARAPRAEASKEARP